MSESADTHDPETGGASVWSASVERRYDSTSGSSRIGPTVVIRGEVVAEEDLVVEGRIEGFIDHSQTVTIHAGGTVAAEVKAQEVLVHGTVEGNVYGIKRVQIAQTGNVTGNVYAPRVGVLEGASFKGSIDMDPDADAIEQRFRETTGSTGSATTSKTHAAAGTASNDKESSYAAQADEEGCRDPATGDSGADDH